MMDHLRTWDFRHPMQTRASGRRVLPAAAGLGLANEEIAKRLERVHVRRHFSAKRERARFELHVHVLFHAINYILITSIVLISKLVTSTVFCIQCIRCSGCHDLEDSMWFSW